MVLLSNVTDVWCTSGNTGVWWYDVPPLVITLILCIGGWCFIHMMKRLRTPCQKGYCLPPYAPGGLWFTLKMRLSQKNAYWVVVRIMYLTLNSSKLCGLISSPHLVYVVHIYCHIVSLSLSRISQGN